MCFKLSSQLLGICYIFWFAIYSLWQSVARDLLYCLVCNLLFAVVEFVTCKLHPYVSVAEHIICSTCFELVGSVVAKTRALYGKSGQCIRLSVWFIGPVAPSASVSSRFELLAMQKLLDPILGCKILVIEGASGTPLALIKLILFVVCAYAPLVITQWLWRLD